MGAKQSKTIPLRLTREYLEDAAKGRAQNLIREAAQKAGIELVMQYIPSACPVHRAALEFDPRSETYKCPHPLCETVMIVPGLDDSVAAEDLFHSNQGHGGKKRSGNKGKRRRPPPQYPPGAQARKIDLGRE